MKEYEGGIYFDDSTVTPPRLLDYVMGKRLEGQTIKKFYIALIDDYYRALKADPKVDFQPYADILAPFHKMLTRAILSAYLIGVWQVYNALRASAIRKFQAELITLPPGVKQNLLARKLLTAKEFYALADDAKQQAWTVSRISSTGLIDRLRDKILGAIDSGERQNQFVKQTAGRLESWHSEVVFRTTVSSAYSAGLWQSTHDEDVADLIWGYEYVTAGDSRVRESHAAMEGKRYSLDSPVWNTWTPPNGYNCRCWLRIITNAEADAEGLRSSRSPTELPDERFRSNPGANWPEMDIEEFTKNENYLQSLVFAAV